ncbi:MAG: ABC transporter substrate-binding protein, partial [Verrucomicrobiota bacterium]
MRCSNIFGFEVTALGSYFLNRAMSLGGLSPGDLNTINVEVDDHEKAYREGLIDVVVTFEPEATRLRELGAVEVFSSRQIPNEIVDLLVVRRSLLKQHEDRIRNLVDAWFRALRLMQSNPGHAFAVLDFRLKLGA